MDSQKPISPNSLLKAECSTLRTELAPRYNEAAINSATIDLHTQPSTIGRLRMPPAGSDALSTHLLLNIAFLYAVHNNAAGFERAFKAFSAVAQEQALDIVPEDVKVDTLRIAKTLNEFAREDCANEARHDDHGALPSITV